MAITIATEFVETNSLDSTSSGPAEADGSAGFGLTGNLAQIGLTGTTYQQTGLKFRTVPIPQGATIISASVGLWSHPILGTRADSVTWKVVGLDVDDAVLDSNIWSVNYRPGTGGTNFIVDSTNDILVLTSDQGGPVNIDIPDGTYTGAALATAIQTAMNADGTLTGSGTITFVVSYASTKFTLDATAGHTIAFTFAGSDAGETIGFRADEAAAQTITSEFDVPGRAPETTSGVDWDRTGFVVDTLYTSPDIASVVQEIVDRPGWAINKNLAIILRNDGTNVGEGFMRQRVTGEIGNGRASLFNCTYSIAGSQIIFIQR